MKEQLTKEVLKFNIPFDNVGTSVFLINTNHGYIMVDCATTEKDVVDHILPALSKAEISLDYIKAIFLTHDHGDHAGGLPYILKAMPHIEVLSFNKTLTQKYNSSRFLTNGEELYGLKFFSLKGHSLDSGGILDPRTNSLITGDALQLWGIGKYGCGIGLPKDYINTILFIKAIAPQNIFTSHEYYPLGSNAFGSNAVLDYLNECKSFFIKVENFIKEQVLTGNKDARLIAEKFTIENQKSYPDAPPFPAWTANEIIKTINL